VGPASWGSVGVGVGCQQPHSFVLHVVAAVAGIVAEQVGNRRCWVSCQGTPPSTFVHSWHPFALGTAGDGGQLLGHDMTPAGKDEGDLRGPWMSDTSVGLVDGRPTGATDASIQVGSGRDLRGLV
jgi:hypothetical protein